MGGPATARAATGHPCAFGLSAATTILKVRSLVQKLRGDWFPAPRYWPTKRAALLGPPLDLNQANLLFRSAQKLSVLVNRKLRAGEMA